MNVGKLAYGAAQARHPVAERDRVARLVEILDESPMTKAVMMRFGLFKAEWAPKGVPLADADLPIAATALEGGMTLVTGNTKHFSRIPGLKLENWF